MLQSCPSDAVYWGKYYHWQVDNDSQGSHTKLSRPWTWESDPLEPHYQSMPCIPDSLNRNHVRIINPKINQSIAKSKTTSSWVGLAIQKSTIFSEAQMPTKTQQCQRFVVGTDQLKTCCGFDKYSKCFSGKNIHTSSLIEVCTGRVACRLVQAQNKII